MYQFKEEQLTKKKILKFKFSEQELSNYQDEPPFQDTEINTNKMEEEIIVQDADFKNKAKAVKNKKEETDESHNPLTVERQDIQFSRKPSTSRSSKKKVIC